jgi:hypothetical protein
MLGQAPIYVPLDATRLRWSLGIYRVPAFSVEGTALEVNVNTVTMYLSSEPCRYLLDQVPGVVTAENEVCRGFHESYLTGAWTSNAIAAGATSNGPGTVYTKVRSDTWTDFAPRGVTNINDRTGDPTAYLIVTATFSGGVTGEQIRAGELCLWFDYADAPFLMDDAARVAARNGRPAMAQVMRKIVDMASKFSTRPRPLFNWWGGNPGNPFETSAEASIRRMWLTGSVGAPALGGQALIVPIAMAADVPKTGLQILEQDDDQARASIVPQSPGRIEDINDADTDLYPMYVTAVPLYGETVTEYDVAAATARELRLQAGSTGPTYGPQLRSGLIFERRPTDPVIGTEVLPTDPYSMGSEIIGAGSTARDLRALRDFINRLARQKMIHFGWGIMKNSTTGTYGHNVTNGFGTDRRYILNTAYGEGGIAPSVDGPGIEIPTWHTSLGRGTTVRAYIRVFARMTGGSNTGLLGYYNKNAVGAMQGAFNVTHTPTISGTTWQWYPNTDTIDEANDPYVTLTASPNFECDHLLLTGGRSGSTDDLLIGAWTVCVRASEAV